MSVVVGIPKEQTPGERRIALVPDTVKRLTKLGATVVIEKGMGESAYFKDAVYTSAGAQIADDVAKLYQQADIVLRVQPPTETEIG